MQSVCGASEKCFRIGGDEFVIIGVGEYDRRSAEDKIQNVEKHIESYNINSDKPYDISISLGYEYAQAASFESIKDVLAAADERMFANKQSFKLSQ